MVADRVGERFIVPLPYGTQVDWLRNVLTADTPATTKGETFELTAPEIIDATEALPLLPATVGEPFERTGIDHYLRASIDLMQNEAES